MLNLLSCARFLNSNRLAACLLLLLPPAAYCQSISPSLSGSIGDSLYSESNLTGPSGSLLPQGTDLTNPSYRTGTSDPLNTLIETGAMSPYVSGVYLMESYANVNVLAQALNDPVMAQTLNEYRNNRAIMAGTLSTGSLLGRALGAGGMVAASSPGRTGGQGDGFGRDAMLAPFAAGSSAVARERAGLTGFVDPNGVASALTSGTALASINSQGASAPAPVTGSAQTSQGLGGTSAAAMSMSSTNPSSATNGAMAAPMQGIAPAQTYPVVGFSAPSSTGFEDSTTGTAGQLQQDQSRSPFHQTAAGSDADRVSPFPDMSGQQTSFLHPSLLAGSTESSSHHERDVQEYARKARLQALIAGTPLPSPFEQHAMERDYRAQHHRARSRSTITAPSVVATP